MWFICKYKVEMNILKWWLLDISFKFLFYYTVSRKLWNRGFKILAKNEKRKTGWPQRIFHLYQSKSKYSGRGVEMIDLVSPLMWPVTYDFSGLVKGCQRLRSKSQVCSRSPCINPWHKGHGLFLLVSCHIGARWGT